LKQAKIAPVKNGTPSPAYFDINKDDNSSLMTETYLQGIFRTKKISKAIQAYEILILKYPEKVVSLQTAYRILRFTTKQ
jgi:hypothetical protein